ncbi:MAG: diphosphomevalonate decarboxylase, partial [Candidatus Micrarchaeota archaeon]
ARLGSGSASRSVFGGFVRWKKGKRKDGNDSYSVQIAKKKHWNEIVDVIVIVDARKKRISSKEGMERTARSSKLMKKRLREVKKRISGIVRAIRKKDFEKFAKITMEDSDSMHEAAAGAHPPVIYMNKISHKIANEVKKLNEKKIIAGYTFDAGPNAHIITLRRHAPKVRKMLGKIKGVKKIIISGIGNGIRN